MQVHVLFDTRGKVHALFQASAEVGSPRLEFHPARGQRVARVEVPAELERLSLRELHAVAAIEPHKDGPRLVQRKR